jgi:hypothetical protein
MSLDFGMFLSRKGGSTHALEMPDIQKLIHGG